MSSIEHQGMQLAPASIVSTSIECAQLLDVLSKQQDYRIWQPQQNEHAWPGQR